MPHQSTIVPASERTLQRIQRLEEERTRLWEQPYRTPDEHCRLSAIDGELRRLWDKRRQEQAAERAAASTEEETEAEAVERRRAARELAGLCRIAQFSDDELAAVEIPDHRVQLSAADVCAIRRAYDQRTRGDITRLAVHYSVGPATIRAIGKRESRTDVPEEGAGSYAGL